jgi:hypothetical protein
MTIQSTTQNMEKGMDRTIGWTLLATMYKGHTCARNTTAKQRNQNTCFFLPSGVDPVRKSWRP